MSYTEQTARRQVCASYIFLRSISLYQRLSSEEQISSCHLNYIIDIIVSSCRSSLAELEETDEQTWTILRSSLPVHSCSSPLPLCHPAQTKLHLPLRPPPPSPSPLLSLSPSRTCSLPTRPCFSSSYSMYLGGLNTSSPGQTNKRQRC